MILHTYHHLPKYVAAEQQVTASCLNAILRFNVLHTVVFHRPSPVRHGIAQGETGRVGCPRMGDEDVVKVLNSSHISAVIE